MKKRVLKKRNPIAKAVRKLRPKVKEDKKKQKPKFTWHWSDDL